MASQLFTNNAKSQLLAPIAPGALSLQVLSGEGALFPTITGADFFYITLSKVTYGIEGSFEIVKVTARAGDVMTIVRAQEGTTALTYVADDRVSLRVTAAFETALEALKNSKDASGGIPGLTLFKLNLRNAADTITSWFTTAATAARTWTMPDQSGTVALTSDITGTNSGTNTGDNAVNSLYSGLVTNATHTGDATGGGALTVVAINGVNMAGLATGILKNTTTTGVPSIATAGTDYAKPNTASTWSVLQTFNNSMMALLGSSTGKTTFASANASGTDYTITFPAATVTLASLTGTETLTNKTLTAPTLADSQLIRAMLIDCGMTVVDKGNSGTSTQTYDYTAGSVQTSTATGNHTIATSNWPPTGNLGSILIQLTNGGAYTITWPTISWIKPDGTTTTSISTYLAALTGRTALQTSGMDQIMLWSRDAGTTIYGKIV